MRTVLCHFYNESYLLPKWLEHHKKIFDMGIMIDYDSTDHSVGLIREICPNWVVLPSNNRDFGAMNVDIEIQNHESVIDGWKMCLNVTEFLHGDFTKCTEQPLQYVIPSFMVVDDQFRDTSPKNFDLDIANDGIPHWVWNERAGRSFHNFNVDYPKPGRHYFPPIEEYSQDFLIFHYGWYPMCEQTLNRKLQIQNRIPEYDRTNRLGWHHITTRDALLNKWQTEYLPKIGNYKAHLNYYRGLTCV